MRVLVAVGIGGIVVVWSHGFGDAPIGHGQLGIKFGGVLERTRGLVVIKAINEPQPLVEELLGLRVVCGDWMMKIPQASDQRDGVRLRVGGMVLRHGAQA